ncbi:nuclear transport factor 2 family protein [Aestuariicella hydrocarbonica]|uniref:Nuclear transport factor 2 family protein n=1 Tax=Pseudomaricurvus hydrocarbonicus TaxID=1470433 RepID=A0A9E5JS36_9GAMM|nr:nuclear transport factor 2 family protein [Aestuariicella hydrocarbonica]NHO64498.1 nuclear transport factor 2 family protein [Aestuariicella hydrocarbonica]
MERAEGLEQTGILEKTVPNVIVQFKELYRNLSHLPVDRFALVYADNIIFRDPVHELRGAADVLGYLETLCERVEFCQFEYLDELIGDDKAYIKWNMNFRHPSLGKEVHSVRGMSHIEFTDRIHYHEDVYDLGEMLYEHIPVLGSATRFLKRRLAA